MKILFFSDAHGNQFTFRKLIQQIQKKNIDLVVFGGDIFGYYYGQKEIISILKNLNCICLMGNHDRYFLDLYDGKKNLCDLEKRYGRSYRDSLNKLDEQDIDFIRKLKSSYEIDIDSLHLFFVHGSVDDNFEGRIYPNTEIVNCDKYIGLDYIFYGHTHHKLIKKTKNGTILVNPGSIGQQRDGKGCSYVIFDSKTRQIVFYEVNFEIKALVAEVKAHQEDSCLEKKLIEVLYRKVD